MTALMGAFHDGTNPAQSGPTAAEVRSALGRAVALLVKCLAGFVPITLSISTKLYCVLGLRTIHRMS
jgi:hypothetical protein